MIKDKARSTNLGKYQQNVLEKIQATLSKCRKTTTPDDSEDANMLSRNRELRIRVVECKLRVRRKICRQARKKGKRMDKASITSSFNALHPL